MAGIVTYLIAFVLAAHGLVHLLGFTVYLDLATVAEFPYKTTLLGGAVDVGDGGVRVFGVLWGVAAVGFVVSAGAFLTDWQSWRWLLVAVTLFSLALTVLDWTVAYAGVVANLGILGLLLVHLRL
ncbi:ABC transporter permease [Natrinema ejinorense]|uniref:ABC transporter permease n=1 Tax=Natrinema ejinorense TaxID=373386 RepID=A0A2A5QW08_9EURY|nr:ABC transporter permease [Natrinema ejinorense]PCR91036.1 ABC transporter permease [Natrinema ejinorense]